MTAVVGLDLSLTATGIATPDRILTTGTRGRAAATLTDRGIRVHDLAMTVAGHVDSVRSAYPASDVLVVIEAPAFDSRTGHQHDRSGLWWLVVDELLGMTDVRVVEVTTGGVKKYATGKGNAGKDEVLAAVVRRYPDIDVSNNNEADALVLRAMGCDWLGQPLVTVPQTHRAALDKVAWPSTAVAA